MVMKKILFTLLAALTFTSCNAQNTNEKMTNHKCLVVFFSHAGENYPVGNIQVGNTKIVADYISELTGADQFEIVTHKYDSQGLCHAFVIPLLNGHFGTKDGQIVTKSGQIGRDSDLARLLPFLG